MKTKDLVTDSELFQNETHLFIWQEKKHKETILKGSLQNYSIAVSSPENSTRKPNIQCY